MLWVMPLRFQDVWKTERTEIYEADTLRSISPSAVLETSQARVEVGQSHSLTPMSVNILNKILRGSFREYSSSSRQSHTLWLLRRWSLMPYVVPNTYTSESLFGFFCRCILWQLENGFRRSCNISIWTTDGTEKLKNIFHTFIKNFGISVLWIFRIGNHKSFIPWKFSLSSLKEKMEGKSWKGARIQMFSTCWIWSFANLEENISSLLLLTELIYASCETILSFKTHKKLMDEVKTK